MYLFDTDNSKWFEKYDEVARFPRKLFERVGTISFLDIA